MITKNPQTALTGLFWGKRKIIVMAKVQQFSEERHALSDRCQAAVGMYRKGISDDVPGKPYVRPIVRGKENPKAELSQAA